MNISSSVSLDEPRFSLVYEIREKSKAFLSSIDQTLKDENIDFWFMCDAYETIEEWFDKKDKKSTLTNINTYLNPMYRLMGLVGARNTPVAIGAEDQSLCPWRGVFH